MTAPSEPRGLLREARLSERALAANLAALTRTRDVRELVVDLRADAYGHGLEEVARRVVAHGITTARISHGAAAPPGLTPVDTPPTSEELLLYGFDTTPVLTLVGTVVAVKHAEAGSGVSYGYTYRTWGETTLALVGLGYADGVPRLGSNLAHVQLGGSRALVAGRIAMDQLVVDLGDGTAEVGDEAVVWASAGDYAEWSIATVRSAPDLTAGLAPRIRRRWVE